MQFPPRNPRSRADGCCAQGMRSTGGGGLVGDPNLHVCKHLWVSEWHMQGREGELISCRGAVQSAWQKPPVRRKEEELSCPHALIRTGKAGENGQHSAEMGGSSPWTPASAPECGHTLKAPAGDQRSINCGDRPRRRLRDRYPLGHRPVVLLRTETARCTVRPT